MAMRRRPQSPFCRRRCTQIGSYFKWSTKYREYWDGAWQTTRQQWVGWSSPALKDEDIDHEPWNKGQGFSYQPGLARDWPVATFNAEAENLPPQLCQKRVPKQSRNLGVGGRS
ncbi:hypothetical protein AMTRI_Chr12g271820 [Amborella trichopoda]